MSSRFFGCQARPNKAYNVQVPAGNELTITAACVECDDAAPSSLHMTIDGKDFVIAAFGGDKLMCNLDLVLCAQQTVSFSIRGTRTVFVTGYFSETNFGSFSEEQAMSEFAECFDNEDGEFEQLKAALAGLYSSGHPADNKEKSKKEKKKDKKEKKESSDKKRKVDADDSADSKKKRKKGKA
eukprot:TRINITY_DN9169_c0_g1_i3.p1 TRINITY_DN9169_c0_g1~~TRINITY_DN9169_c0_g1_i3.p1  ORF type:complete len:200 (+),score=92.37 TRINITY_DN9169_c0_g1_i3:55-600(+)